MEKHLHGNQSEKKAWGAILILSEIDFKTKTNERDKQKHYMMIKGTIKQENITMINIYIPKRFSKHMKQKLKEFKGEIETFTIIVIDLNVLL